MTYDHVADGFRPRPRSRAGMLLPTPRFAAQADHDPTIYDVRMAHGLPPSVDALTLSEVRAITAMLQTRRLCLRSAAARAKGRGEDVLSSVVEDAIAENDATLAFVALREFRLEADRRDRAARRARKDRPEA